MIIDDRFKAALSNFIKEQFPNYPFMGVYEYQTDDAAGATMQGFPTAGGLTGLQLPVLPDLHNVPLLPSIIGGAVTFSAAGVKFLVAFVNGDPSRPVVIAGDPNTLPTTISLAGGAALQGAARFGDTVVAGPFAGTITKGSAIVRIGG